MDLDRVAPVISTPASRKDSDVTAQCVEQESSPDESKSNGLQDAVISVLSKTPNAALSQFFKPTTTTFKSVYRNKDLKLVIWRKGIEVFVSLLLFMN